MSDPNYVVIRDPEYEQVNGKWYDLNADRSPFPLPPGEVGEEILFVATPFIEVREDGAVAQVYMRRENDE